MAPIKTESIILSKCDLFQNRLLVAIDSGCSLTKILFLNEKDQAQFLNKEDNCITLEFSLFLNADFEEALQRIKDHAVFMEDSPHKIHITGSFAISNKDKVKTILNREAVYIDEFLTIKFGVKVALDQIGIEKLRVKDVPVEKIGKLENKMINKFWETFRNELDKVEKPTLYPCVFHVHGSLAGCFYFNDLGAVEYFGLINEGGKSFLGLAKCILDTNDYNEIVTLASKGNVQNVDTQLKEVLEGVITPYGKIDPEIPIFSFGKLMDYDKESEMHFAKEDLALSLVMHQIKQIVLFCSHICLIKKTSKVYLIGNIFSSDVFHRALKFHLQMREIPIKFEILNLGYFGVLGAMLSDES